MGKWSGTRLTDADIEAKCQQEVRAVLRRLNNGEIDPPDAARQLIDLIVKAANTLARLARAEG